jgi:WD40 repeat protein/serine/threonine protein kinase
VQPVHLCPDPQRLEQFLLGKLPAAEALELELHVTDCSQCARALASLDARDGLVVAMQAEIPDNDTPPELIAAVIPTLKRMRPQQNTVTLPSALSTDTPMVLGPNLGVGFLSPAQAEDEIGRLGPYRVLGLLGSGGMGMVFLAHDPVLDRRVALKVIRPELLAREDVRGRFFEEARAVARLEHDNIVVIHHIDLCNGVPYLVMPLLRGETLEDRLGRVAGPLPLGEVLRIGQEIASGLVAAHARGLVHRDIKPSNIFLEAPVDPASADRDSRPKEPYETTTIAEPANREELGNDSPAPGSRAPGPAQPPGRARILDFGLACALGPLAPGDRRENTIAGTPAYMAPEQASGQGGDARVDLFSLGCVLYRMATGRAPFRGDDVLTTLMSVALEEPPRPRALNPKLPRRLDVLIWRLLRKKASDRPTSAQSVADELAALARPRRTVWLLATAAALLAGAGLTAWLFPREVPPLPPDPGEVVFSYDEEDRRITLQGSNDPAETIDLARNPRKQLPPGNYRVKAVQPGRRKLWPDNFTVESGKSLPLTLRLVGEIRQVAPHSGPVFAVALSPLEGSLLALSASGDRSVGVWDAAGDRVECLEGHGSAVRCVAFAPDGERAASGGGDNRKPTDLTIRLWNVFRQKETACLRGHESHVTAVAFTPGGEHLLSGGADGVVLLWDVKTEKVLRTFGAGHDRRGVHALAVAPDGKQALTGGGDDLALLWDLASGKVIRKLESHTRPVRGVAFSPDGLTAFTAGGEVQIWDLKQNTNRTLDVSGGVFGVACSPDGRRLLTAGGDGVVRLWNLATNEKTKDEEICPFEGHRGAVRSVAFSRDGRRALSGGEDGTLRLWELPK